MNHIFASHAKHSTYTHSHTYLFNVGNTNRKPNNKTLYSRIQIVPKKETIKHHINNKRTIRIALLYFIQLGRFFLCYIRAIQILRYCSAHSALMMRKKIERIWMCNLYNQTQPQCLLVKFEKLEFQAQLKSELNSFETMWFVEVNQKEIPKYAPSCCFYQIFAIIMLKIPTRTQYFGRILIHWANSLKMNGFLVNISNVHIV